LDRPASIKEFLVAYAPSFTLPTLAGAGGFLAALLLAVLAAVVLGSRRYPLTVRVYVIVVLVLVVLTGIQSDLMLAVVVAGAAATVAVRLSRPRSREL
jgi:hypothetical protein